METICSCGAALKPGNSFCQGCGKRLQDEKPEEQISDIRRKWIILGSLVGGALILLLASMSSK